MDKEANAMQEQIDATMDDLGSKLGELEHEVSGSVRKLADSVSSVRDSLDLKLHVRQRPWTLMMGATTLGFLGGFRSRSSSTSNGHAAPNGRQHSTPRPRSVPPKAAANEITKDAKVPSPTAEAGPSWISNMSKSFEPELAELKGIAIGTLIGLVRELVLNKARKSTVRSPSNSEETQE